MKQHKPSVEAFNLLVQTCERILELDGYLNEGRGDKDLRREISTEWAAFRWRTDAFCASFCDGDDSDEGPEHAEACMQARCAHNIADNEPPHVPDATTRAIYRRAGGLL